ncbi:hypothetical protein ACP0IF_31065 [Pseudomonas aeruginosa]
MSNELTDVRCPCGAEFQADSYDAGFIAGSGMCQNCDAALPPKDICTCPSGDGSLVHPCPAHPAPVEQAGGDERDFQAKGAQEVPSPVSKEYDRHLISLLRKGEALPGHQEEAADEIERLRDWNDHLNNTVLPNILNPTFLMLMKGGERLLDLCTKDGKFIGVSLNDMKDVFDWMVTHARIAPDHAALAQPSPAQAEQHWPKLEKPVQVGAIRFHAGLSSRLVVEAAQRLYEFESTPEKEAERIERLQAFREQLDPLNLAPHAEAFNEAPAEALKPEQAEAELDFSRPLETENGEPVKWICADVIEYKSARVCVAKDTGLVYSSPYIGLKIRNVMPEQAEAERPEVVAYRTVGRHAKHQHPHFALNYYKQNAEDQAAHWRERGCEVSEDELMTVAQHERITAQLHDALDESDGDRWKLRSERDAANARLHEVATACATAEQERDAALARVAELERQQPVAWMHDQPNRVDVIHRDVKDLLQRVPGSSRGIHRPLDVSEHYTIPLYAAPVAQAQHSVPEVSGIGRDFAYPRSVVLYLRTEPTDDDLRAIHDGLRSLAAAPGKEVPQAWLDVQAERRRQITAEGWTPDHDDLYCAAELPRAAAAYILSGANDEAPAIWPFSAKWWKPRDARANYMRAGALILAEIERLDRAAAPGKEVGHE